MIHTSSVHVTHDVWVTCRATDPESHQVYIEIGAGNYPPSDVVQLVFLDDTLEDQADALDRLIYAAMKGREAVMRWIAMRPKAVEDKGLEDMTPAEVDQALGPSGSYR